MPHRLVLLLMILTLSRLPAAAPPTEVQKAWDARLLALVQAQIQAKKPPKFALSAMGGEATVTAADATGSLKLGAGGTEMTFRLDRLPALDRKNLAESVRRPNTPEDAALVAWYWLLAGKVKEAQKPLGEAGAAADEVRRHFDTTVAAPVAKTEPKKEAEKPKPVETGWKGPFGFRGDGRGRFPDAKPPTFWGPGQNIVWSTPMPDWANASPALSADKVFTTAQPNLLVCCDRRSGAILWQAGNSFAEATGNAAGDADLPKPDWLGTYGFTTPTPVTDGTHVWAVFGHGIVTCFTVDGKRVWASTFEAKNRVSGVAPSPMLVNGLIVFTGKGNPRIRAVDAKTGQERWSCGGHGDGTSVPVEINGVWHLVNCGGTIVKADNGSEVFRGLLGGGFQGATDDAANNWGPTPAVGDGQAFFHVHFKKSGNCSTAIRAVDLATGKPTWEYYTNPDGNIRGRMGRSHLWHDGLVYAIKDNGLLQVLDAKTGALVYEQEKMGGSYVSLTLAGPYLYHFSKDECVIFKPGRAFEQVARFKHGFEAHISSPVFDGTQMFYRCKKALWCIGGSATGPAPAAKPAPKGR